MYGLSCYHKPEPLAVWPILRPPFCLSKVGPLFDAHTLLMLASMQCR